MKFLIIGSTIEGGLSQSLGTALLNTGCSVFYFDDRYKNDISICEKIVTRFFWKQIAKNIQNNLINKISIVKPNAIIVLKGFYLNKKTYIKIKSQYPNIIIFHFHPDNPYNTWHFGNSNNWIRESIPYIDIHLTWGKFLMERLKKNGAKKVIYFPFGYDRVLHKKIEIEKHEYSRFQSDIAFIGSWDREREAWLKELVNYDIKIWGNGWEKASKSIKKRWQGIEAVGSNFYKVCNSSKINLNIIRKQNIPGVNMRTFEITSSGGFMLATRTVEQSAIFEEAIDCDYFGNSEELKTKINFYLNNPTLIDLMRKRAKIKVIKMHSYEERAKLLKQICYKTLSNKF